MLARVREPLRQALNGPRPANRDARLLVTFAPPAVTYLEPNAQVEEGLVLKLGPQFTKVDEYLGVSGSSENSAQVALPLRPTIATGRRGIIRR